MAVALNENGEVLRYCMKACDSYGQAISLTINISPWNQGDANNYCFCINSNRIQINTKVKGG